MVYSFIKCDNFQVHFTFKRFLWSIVVAEIFKRIFDESEDVMY